MENKELNQILSEYAQRYNEARLFFVVDTPDTNCEIFATYREAWQYTALLLAEREDKKSDNLRIYISLVNHAYYDDEISEWNYVDYSDTFNHIEQLR